MIFKKTRWLCILVSGVILICSGSLMSNQDINVTVKKISDRLIILNTGGSEPTNIIAFNTARGVILIDTERSCVFARAIMAKVDEVFGKKPITHVINTHEHGDHTYGNQVFSGAVIIGHKLCKEGIEKNSGQPGKTVPQINNGIRAMKMQLEKIDKNSDAAAELKKKDLLLSKLCRGIVQWICLDPSQ